MGFFNWWSRVRNEVHSLEPESCMASRLAHTPPEFWQPKDWTESRRLRHRRHAFYEAQVKRGRTMRQAMLLADERFPPGPFWPHTSERNEALRRRWFDERKMRAILRYVGLEPDEGEYVEFWEDGNGIMRATNLLTMKDYPLTHFGM